jgi:L-amino acid N-acyltransferase YncA
MMRELVNSKSYRWWKEPGHTLMRRKIRVAAPSDAGGIVEIYGPYCEESPISFEIRRPTLDEMEERIVKIGEHYPWLICQNGPGIAGFAYAGPHRERAAYRWAVDVAVYVAPNFRGLHVGTALYTSLFEILRIQGFYKAYAGITVPNPESVGLHKNLGFEFVGTYRDAGFKAGSWHNVSWWELTLQKPGPRPLEPISIANVMHREEYFEAMNRGQQRLGW